MFVTECTETQSFSRLARRKNAPTHPRSPNTCLRMLHSRFSFQAKPMGYETLE